MKNVYLSFLSDDAFEPDVSPSVKSALRQRAITGLGVIGDKDVLPHLQPFLHDPYYRDNTAYDPQTGFLRTQGGARYYPVREKAKRVIQRLEHGEQLTLDDVKPQED